MNDQESIALLSPAKSKGAHKFPKFPVPHDPNAPVNLDGAGISYDAAHCEMSDGVQIGEVWSGGIDWPVVVWIVLVHALALVAPFFFSWQAVLVCAILMIMTGAMGVCMGYHRCLTHGSFKTYRPVRWLLAFLGGLSGEGSALTWVANHRKHHHYSDHEGDPHSPRDGAWWSHMLWFMPNFGRRWHKELVEKYARYQEG